MSKNDSESVEETARISSAKQGMSLQTKLAGAVASFGMVLLLSSAAREESPMLWTVAANVFASASVIACLASVLSSTICQMLNIAPRTRKLATLSMRALQVGGIAGLIALLIVLFGIHFLVGLTGTIVAGYYTYKIDRALRHE